MVQHISGCDRGVNVTWSSQAAVCWAESAVKSWSHWTCVFPRRLKLWSRCAQRPRSHYQLKPKHDTVRLQTKHPEWVMIVISQLERHMRYIIMSQSFLNCCISFSPPINYLYKSQLQTFLSLSDLKGLISITCERSNRGLWFTSLSVVPVPIIQFILLASWTGPSRHGNSHQHHQQTGRSHDEQTGTPPFKTKTGRRRRK